MLSVSRVLIAALLLLGMSACTKDPETIYLTQCASCHEGQIAKAPHRYMLSGATANGVYTSLTDGTMHTLAVGLNDAEKRAVAEFVTGKLMQAQDAYPVLMCQADRSAFDFDAPPPYPGWGMDDGNTRLMSSATMTKADMSRLNLKWAFAYPSAMRARSQPMFAGGAIFVGSQDGSVFSLDAASGCVRWRFKASAEVRSGVVIDSWAMGDRGARPKLYFGDYLGNVYAVDAVTGELVWRELSDDHPNATITAAPARFENLLLVPISSMEVMTPMDPIYPCCAFRGSVIAYDAGTGARVWQTHTIVEEPSVRGKNAAGTDQYGPSGAAVWNTPAVDRRRRQLYFGTGQNYSSPTTLTSDAVFALSIDTGEVIWTFQATPVDAFNAACLRSDTLVKRPGLGRDNCPQEDGPDFDFGAATILTTDSRGRDYLLGGQKSGVVHALDPATGALIWQTRVGRGSLWGGVHFGMAAEGDRLFVPINDMFDGREYATPAYPGIHALDIKTGEFLWRMPTVDVCDGRLGCNPGISAAVSASPGLVFAGAMDGHMRIHDTQTGELLWDYDSTIDYDTLSGERAHGGSFGGGTSPLVVNGSLYFNSGYTLPGNVLLHFGAGS